MESWDHMVANYSRVVDLRTLGNVMRTALLALQEDLQEVEAERLAKTFLFHPISALDLVRFLEEDSVWTKPLCDLFKVITTLINKYPNSVQSYYDVIIVACNVPVSGRASSAALRCLRAACKHTTPATVPNTVAALLRTEPNARIERALLLGTLCDLYPETVTDIEDVVNALLELLTATTYSDSVSEAALRSIGLVLRHFSSDLSAQQLSQIHRHLSRHIYCKRCREAVLTTVAAHAPRVAACAVQSSMLRARAWSRPSAAAALYCALMPALTAHGKQKVITDELLPRINNPRAGVRGAARCVLTAAGHPVPRYKVPGYQESEDVHGLRLRLLAGCDVDYELADTIWWCIANKLEGSERLLDTCVCAHARFPPITRRKLLTRAFYASSAEHLLRRIDLIIQHTAEPAVQRCTALCSELFHREQRTAEQLKAGQLLNLLLSVLVGELDSYTDYLMENDIITELPPEKRRVISQIETVLAAAKLSRLPVNKALILRLRTALQTVGLRCGPEVAGEQLRLILESQYEDALGAGDTGAGEPSPTEVLAKLTTDQDIYFVDRIDILAKYCLSDPLILSRPNMSRHVELLYHVTRWCMSRDNHVPSGLSELLDTNWSAYISSQGTSAGVHLLTIAGTAVKPGGVVANWAGEFLEGSADVEDKARVLAAMGDQLLSGDAVDSVISEIRQSLPARLEECRSGLAARALLALLCAAAAEQQDILLDMLAALAAGPSEAGWWEDAMSGGLQVSCAGAYKVTFLLGTMSRVLSGNNPIAAGDRLLLPVLRNCSEKARSQFLSEGLPTLVTTLRGTKHAKYMPRALLTFRVILLMMETVPPQSIGEQCWRALRDVCALSLALRKLRASDLRDTLRAACLPASCTPCSPPGGAARTASFNVQFYGRGPLM